MIKRGALIVLAALLASPATAAVLSSPTAAAPATAPPPAASQAQLQAARRAAAAHKTAAAAARAQARADAANAAILAERQVAAAAALRRLETRTGDDAASLAALQARARLAAGNLQQSEAALATLLPLMQRLARQPAAIMLTVPESPDDSIRGLIIMQGIAAGIEQQAEAVNRQSSAVAALLRQKAARQTELAGAVAVQQRAEAALTAQIGAAKAAEMADAATGLAETAAAVAANRKIQGLQAVITQLRAAPSAAPAAVHINIAGGAPVAGAIIERFGDGTVAGPAEGVSYRAAPGARVVTPCAGPVLFANKFQTYGMVVIMDCGGGYDFVLSGMQHLDVATGQRLAHGQPVGEMLGYNARDPARQPVLYVELRQNGTPVDPAGWLGGGGSG